MVLSADGPGGTYQLINSVLAPGYNVIEAPDCGHIAFGEHIDEVFDAELNQNVFRFIIHTTPDDDRCINTDRQRNEIKTYDKSPANLLGVENESVRYGWKFKLPAGFQSSPKFTHIHQLKSVGDPFNSMPMYTLTTRKGNPDRLELRYAEFGSQVTLAQTDLAPLMGKWLAVTETIDYSNPGGYSIEIRQVSDNSILFSYSDGSTANWRNGASFIRPKWGIYRSLDFSEDLRDEEVRYADFSIEELPLVSNVEREPGKSGMEVFPNPGSNRLTIRNIPEEVSSVQLFGRGGKKLLEKAPAVGSEVKMDISGLAAGTYMLKIVGKKGSQSQWIVVGEE